ncbi:radical SAM protein [Clostridium tunisiense]|uniref:radical SAM protein n=1 Tax=Clostridium tunisiense TaxID=219748 RepID=UPI0002FCD9BB|nr:radical SAM protein [Clostridium tunisiense]
MKESSFGLNTNIKINMLRNGKKYLMIKHNKQHIPLFIKEKYLELIEDINKNKKTMEEILRMYSEKDLDILMSANIVVTDKSNTDIGINLDMKRQLEKFGSLALNSRTPVHANLEITYSCNYKCKYCFIDSLEQKTMSFEDIKGVLNKLKKLGVVNLLITGGEVFLHPNIMDIIDLAHKLGFKLNVQTNGSLMNEEIVKKLSTYDDLEIVISYHSSIEADFDEFTQVRGSYKQTIKVSKILEKYNIPYLFKHIVTSENEHSMKENIEFLENNKIPFIIGHDILPNIGDDRDNSKFQVKEETIEWLHENNYCNFSKSYCSACKTKLWVSPEGEVHPCELVRKSMGNIIHESLEDIWEGEKAKEILCSHLFETPEKCINCNIKDYCNKCLAYSNYDSWGGNFENYCTVAKIMKKCSIKKLEGIC